MKHHGEVVIILHPWRGAVGGGVFLNVPRSLLRAYSFMHNPVWCVAAGRLRLLWPFSVLKLELNMFQIFEKKEAKARVPEARLIYASLGGGDQRTEG